MKTTELSFNIEENRSEILSTILSNSYVPKSILGVKNLRGKGKSRLLGIPTVVERWLQQTVSQQLMVHFEYDFESVSYGFRPHKNIQKAVLQAQQYINNGFQDIVVIDLKEFFDKVDQSILLQLIYHKVKCPITLRLIRKWLRSSHINQREAPKAKKWNSTRQPNKSIII